MPSKSAKQARFMRAAAHDPGFASRAGISQSVAREFVAADRSKSMKSKSKPHPRPRGPGRPKNPPPKGRAPSVPVQKSSGMDSRSAGKAMGRMDTDTGSRND